MTTITVSYPAGPSFDMDYYLATHMPLVQSRWGEMGLSGWQVLRGVPGPDGAAPASQITTLLVFSSVEAFKAAAGRHGAEIFADIPNFTQAQPVLVFNEAAAQWP